MPALNIETSRDHNLWRKEFLLNDGAEKIKRLAAIDIGTNSTHLLIAAVNTKLKTFTIELAEKSNTRLGEKDLVTGDLTEIAMGRAFDTLKRFKELAESHKVENVLTAATSAVREAANGKEFVTHIKNQIDLDVEVISGTEEARLIYLGVLSGMQFGDQPHILIDIGGGSTELILADAHDSRALTSTKVGAVRLKRDFIKQEPISEKRCEFLRTFIEGSLEPSVAKILNRLEIGSIPLVVATSGTAMAIGALIASEKGDMNLKMQGYKISKSRLDSLVEKLVKMSADQLRKLTPLSERRAEIIVPGALILQTTMKMLDAEEIFLSERALREGLVVDWMFRNSLPEDRFSLQGSIRQRTVLHQAERFRVNLLRSESVARNALTLYDASKGLLHNDEGEGKELLWAAAILHSCGRHININSYHKHSWYLIKNAELLGYSHGEHLIVAGIARYHRKSFPKKRHEAWQCLGDKNQRQIVSQMSILLRLCKSIDQRPEPVVSSLRVQPKSSYLEIELIPTGKHQNLSLEKWSLKNELRLIADNINVNIQVI
tara:strand:+ start:1943 stop:3580 length:1638 start_codon:yes stop_codon:yes gene_type:complete